MQAEIKLVKFKSRRPSINESTTMLYYPQVCKYESTGIKVLAIWHNPKYSWGYFFHIFMDKTSTRLEFLYNLGSALNID